MRFIIKTNVLLKGAEKTTSLAEALLLKSVFDMGSNTLAATGSGDSGAGNLSSLSEQQLKEIHSVYGEAGLFKLIYMAYSHNAADFNHFFELIPASMDLSRILVTEEELECDNDQLPQCADVAKFNLNVMQPSLSRKLYNPGRHHGYMVYGLGGPKILVSHPFQGIKGEIYDVYNNSIDVVTSLMMRGYDGTFLFLDNLPGLNFETRGVPGWLLWFSIIAIHSDLVLFIKEYEEGFRPSQKREIEFTPDRVQKKIVEIPHQELTWATKPEYGDGEEFMYVTGKKGGNTKEDFYKAEAEHAAPFIEEYGSAGFPQDRLIRIDGDELTEYPRDYPIYGSSPT